MRNNSNLPASLRLLFNNPYLEMMNVLFIINSFSKRSGLSIRHLLFYYSLTVSGNETLLLNKNLKVYDLSDSENIYFDVQRLIKDILLNLYSQGFITIESDKSDNFKCYITSEGKEILSQLESSYYKELQAKIEVIKSTKYSVEAEKMIMGVKK
ncbi:hypothetical protein [Paenibacillus sp. CMAA1364]